MGREGWGVDSLFRDIPFTIMLLVVKFIFLMGNTSTFIRKYDDVTEQCRIPSLVVKVAVITVKADLPRATIDIATTIAKGGTLTIDGTMKSGVFGLVIMIKTYALFASITIRVGALGVSFPVSVLYTVLLLVLNTTKVSLKRVSKIMFVVLFLSFVLCVVHSTRTSHRGGIRPKIRRRRCLLRTRRVRRVSVKGDIVCVVLNTMTVTIKDS